MSEFPEHDKLHAVRERSQAIGEFLEFGPWSLCEYGPTVVNIQECIFGINNYRGTRWKDSEGDKWVCINGRLTRWYDAWRAQKRGEEPVPDEDRWCVMCKGEGVVPIYDDRWTPVAGNINDILAQYFGVDLDKLEAEKRLMLERQRTLNRANG